MKPAAPPSAFVTVIAWISLGLGGLSLAAALLKLALLPLVRLALDDMVEVESHFSDAGMATVIAGMFTLLVWATAITAALSAAAVAAGIGLLRRREWGRVLFQWLLVAGAALAWLALWPLDSYVDMLAAPMRMNAEFYPNPGLEDSLRVLRLGLAVVGVLLAGAVTAVHLWLVRRLASPSVRDEFG